MKQDDVTGTQRSGTRLDSSHSNATLTKPDRSFARFAVTVSLGLTACALEPPDERDGILSVETQPVVGHEPLTDEDIAADLRAAGVPEVDIPDAVLHAPAVLSADLAGDPSEGAQPLIGNEGNLFFAWDAGSNMVEQERRWDPLTSPADDDQRYRFSGDHWYHNESPSRTNCSYGQWTNRETIIRYMQGADAIPGRNNAEVESIAWACTVSSGNAMAHQVVLYYLDGSEWRAFWTATRWIDPKDIFQRVSEHTVQFRAYPGQMYLARVNLYSNGWNPAGWPDWRHQQTQWFLPGPLQWSYAGPHEGLHCTSFHEPAVQDFWRDNYLCSTVDHGIRFSHSGPIPGLRCTSVNEPSDLNGWHDNYVCVPHSSSLHLQFSHSGPISGRNCILIDEPGDFMGWDDNYICW